MQEQDDRVLPIVRDIRWAIDNDEWMWLPAWGVQRGGKSTCAMQLAFEIYQDWDEVLASFVFTLPELVRKNKAGIPRRFPTRQGFNMRVPVRIYDDMAADCNKAVRRYNIAYDELKAYFQVMGTKLGVLIGTMAHPTDLTTQLVWKYTHEIWVFERGRAKYDKARWQQNYNGWQPKTDKDWQNVFSFEPVPADVYQEYNEMRMSIADEVEVRIMDKLTEDNLAFILKRLGDKEIDMLRFVQKKSPVTRDVLRAAYPEYRETMLKLRARYLILSTKRPGTDNYEYDASDFGLEVLKALDNIAVAQAAGATTAAAKVAGVSALSIKAKPQVASPIMDLTIKKQVAESLKTQGIRVTEGFADTEPDLIAWKDGVTPSEIIAVRTLSTLPAIVNVQISCAKEIAAAQHYNLEKLRLICFNALTNNIVYDNIVTFTDSITIEDTSPQAAAPEVKAQNVIASRGQNLLTLNKEFQASPIELTERVVAVSDAFGLGVDDQKAFEIFKDISFKYDDSDLIYVTGDSGSGKSTFLKLFEVFERQRQRSCANIASIQIDENAVVINSIGANKEEAMAILGTVGLSEAFLMLRRYKDLSEGQRYRYKLAKLIETKADTFLIDEFGATLDREMAKVLAYCVQKWARANKKTFAIATTHKDLVQDFNPSIVFDCKFGGNKVITYYEPKSPPKFSLLEQVRLEKGDQEDYKKLAGFHYLAGSVAGRRQIYKLTFEGEPIGVIVYSVSFYGHHIRNQLFPEYKSNIQKVNAEISRISRVIIHPKFRGVGLAHELVRLTMPLTHMRLIETVAAMPKYNPFFERAGMTFGGKQEFAKEQKKLLAFLEAHGQNVGLLQDFTTTKGFLNSLSSTDFAQLLAILQENINARMGSSPRGAQAWQNYMNAGKAAIVLKKTLPVERVYLYWLNPAWKPATEDNPALPTAQPSQ